MGYWEEKETVLHKKMLADLPGWRRKGLIVRNFPFVSRKTP
jgi:hypothetical protein